MLSIFFWTINFRAHYYAGKNQRNKSRIVFQWRRLIRKILAHGGNWGRYRRADLIRIENHTITTFIPGYLQNSVLLIQPHRQLSLLTPRRLYDRTIKIYAFCFIRKVYDRTVFIFTRLLGMNFLNSRHVIRQTTPAILESLLHNGEIIRQR